MAAIGGWHYHAAGMLILNDQKQPVGRIIGTMIGSRRCQLSFLILILVFGEIGVLAADTPAFKPPPRTIYDITEILSRYRPDPEATKRLRDQLEEKEPAARSNKDLAKFYKRKAVIGDQIGDSTAYVINMRKVVDLGGDRNISDDLMQLAFAEFLNGNYLAADAAISLGLRGIPARANPGKWRSLYGLRARISISLGDFEATQDAAKQEQAQFDISMHKVYAGRFVGAWRAGHYTDQAGMAIAAGRLSDAETMFQKAIEAAPLAIEEASRERALPEASATYFSDSAYEWLRNTSLMSIGTIRVRQGRLTEAEILARQGLIQSIEKVGRYSFYTGSLIHPFVQILMAQGRYAEAGQMARAGVDIFEQIGCPQDSLWMRDLRQDLAESMVAQSNYSAALLEYQRLLDAYAASPVIQSQVGVGSLDWAVALLKMGKPHEASKMLAGLMQRNTQWLGTEHIDTVEIRGVRGMALAASGQRELALADFRAALPMLMDSVISQGDEPSPLRSARLKLILEAYLGLLGDVRGTPIEAATGIDAASEAFRLTDALRSQSTQGAVAASALRAFARDPAIGGEIRKEQDLTQEMAALHKILRDLMNVPNDQQLPNAIDAMKARITTVKKERSAIQAGIEKRFPAYANLMRPQPPSLANTRAILHSGEALINIFSTDTATYVWAFKRDGQVAFARAKLTREELRKLVQGVRSALDPGDIDLASGIPDFDLDAAYGLYDQLLAPVAPGWQGATHLLIASNSSLGQLPLAVLPTAKVSVNAVPPIPYSQYEDVPWLIRKAAFTELPSVNALLALRNLPPATAQRTPFIGFGDPQFNISMTQVASHTRGLRDLAVGRPSPAEVDQAISVQWMDYAKIPPLPDTRDEILALAELLKADLANDVFLGSKASRANVKKLDLSNRRVVAFATHGLLADDFPGVSEPSLALANPGDGQHGLLTLEDILGLKLDADWVVLSACNTAAGDGQGADALSGLGRGFFYAGSRALLVTHWPVESVSARLLVTGVFERQAADAKLSRAEALRQSMLDLMRLKNTKANFAYAHPLFWAPYALVGEGGN